jgi:nitrate reductase molybdenum cofactor assembly chaperone NarJ/NarW
MLTLANQQQLCRDFATLLSYPDISVRQTATASATLLRENASAATESMTRFASFLQGQEPARLEELFTATFDLQPVCHPYVGYLLCGESQQRTLFLIRLQQLYQQHGFELGSELPDHLATLLRFVGTVADRDCCRELIRDGLLPALDKLAEGLTAEQPYAALLEALHNFLTETVDAGPELLVANGGRS